MKRKLGIVCTLLMVALAAQGCAKGQEEKTERKDSSSFKGKYVISAQEANEKAEKGTAFFLDARGGKKALLGTVKGAVATEWQKISTCKEGKAGDESWGLVPEPEKYQELLQELGIEKEREIIVIGQPEDGWGDDGRIVWQLRQAGCTDVKVVDGGYTAMKDAGLQPKLGASKAEKSDIKIDKLDTAHDITTKELQQDYESYKIVDVRTKEEYDGAVLYDEAKGGHLPDAIHIPYTGLFKEDGTLKGNEELIALFEKSGLEKEDKIVTYCTGGIRSAYMQLVLEMCGYENTYNYGQSFWRWANVGEVE